MNGTLGDRLVHEDSGARLLGWGLPGSAVSGVGCYQRQPATILLGLESGLIVGRSQVRK